MKEEKLKNLKELIDSFDNKYYEKEIKKLETEILNIGMGENRYKGIYDNLRPMIVPEGKRTKEIEKLEKKIKDTIKKSKELNNVLSQLRQSAYNLEALSKTDILLDNLKTLTDRKSNYFKEIKETENYQKNSKKYFRLYLKSKNNIKKPKMKISKELYKLIKKNLSYIAYQSKTTIRRALDDNKISIAYKESPGNKIYSDVRKEYGAFPYSDDIKRLGVNLDKVRDAINLIEGDLNRQSLTWEGKNVFDKFKNIERAQKINIETNGGYAKLKEVKEKCIEILELSRETWYINEILIAFINTDVSHTEMYKGLQELVNEQEKEISEKTDHLDKLYEKTGLQTKIELMEKLEELYAKSEELRLKIEQNKQDGYAQVDYLEEEYYKLRYEMMKILTNNPDLNNSKYKIDVENIIKKEMGLFESEIKKEITKKESSYIAEEEKFVEKITEEESKEVENLELDSNLQIHRIMHYQNYMREKVINSDLGKLSFSAYLESVAPHLTELINIEKEREKLARTIYRDYLKYYSSLENKKDAIEFYEFASNNYDISNVDVPVEYEEEYKGMIKI